MRFIPFTNRKQAEKLDQIEREATQVHQKNINKLKANRKKIDTLNVALKQNNIVFQLAHVIGHQK